MGVETRFLVEKADYGLRDNPHADVGENETVSSSCLDVVRVYSSFEVDPATDFDNYEDYYAGQGKKKTYLRLKPTSAQRLKGQIIDTLVRLAELSPLPDDEGDADDWGCSKYVVGDYEVRHVVWIERDAEKNGKYEIKRKAYIKKSLTI